MPAKSLIFWNSEKMLISLNVVCSLLEMFALGWFFQSTIQTQCLLVGVLRS